MSTHDDCTGYDFAAGHATGLRSFNVDSLGRLKGVTYPRVWKPGENVADCNNSEERDAGRCDDDSHGCGFWAYHDGSTYDAGQVRGVVEGYGRTTVGAKGFRAERARIVALHIPSRKPATKPERSRWDRFCIWADRHDVPVIIGGCILAAVGLLFTVAAFGSGELWGLGLAVPVLAAGCSMVAASMRGADLAPSRYSTMRIAWTGMGDDSPVSAELAAKVRRNYPGVKFYDSVEAMKSAHPVDKALEPSPETDPTFWDDKPIDGDSVTGTWKLSSSAAPFGYFPPPTRWRIGGQL